MTATILALALSAAPQRLLARRDPAAARVHAAPGARGRPLRSRDDADQSQRRHRVREAPGGCAREPAAGAAVHAVAGEPSAARRTDRFHQSVPSVARRTAAGLRRQVQEMRTDMGRFTWTAA